MLLKDEIMAIWSLSLWVNLDSWDHMSFFHCSEANLILSTYPPPWLVGFWRLTAVQTLHFCVCKSSYSIGICFPLLSPSSKMGVPINLPVSKNCWLVLDLVSVVSLTSLDVSSPGRRTMIYSFTNWLTSPGLQNEHLTWLFKKWEAARSVGLK